MRRPSAVIKTQPDAAGALGHGQIELLEECIPSKTTFVNFKEQENCLVLSVRAKVVAAVTLIQRPVLIGEWASRGEPSHQHHIDTKIVYFIFQIRLEKEDDLASSH